MNQASQTRTWHNRKFPNNRVVLIRRLGGNLDRAERLALLHDFVLSEQSDSEMNELAGNIVVVIQTVVWKFVKAFVCPELAAGLSAVCAAKPVKGGQGIFRIDS
jgi:hypothetical protein